MIMVECWYYDDGTIANVKVHNTYVWKYMPKNPMLEDKTGEFDWYCEICGFVHICGDCPADGAEGDP